MACDFVCDSTSGYVKNASGTGCACDGGLIDYGTYCGCPAGEKLCNGSCVSATSTANGCSGASCTACALPAHASATSCNGSGGTCDFECDAAGHWVRSGSICVCEPGYTESGGACVGACLGSVYDGRCYWYVSAASSWDAAQATCAGNGGHLASIADTAESNFVRGLAGGTFWIGLRDNATISMSVNADDCSANVWLSGDGGRYTGTTYEWDDFDPCNLSTGPEDVFGMTVIVPSVYVFSTAHSNYDTIVGLYTRVNDTSGFVTCIGSALECDDDDGPGSTSLIVRYLSAGDYTILMDSYSLDSGTFVLDVRRFDFVDGSAHAWANWGTEEPNNAGSGEDCTEVNPSTGKWNDNACGVSRPFVCESP